MYTIIMNGVCVFVKCGSFCAGSAMPHVYIYTFGAEIQKTRVLVVALLLYLCDSEKIP